jgi:hypothetical protein
MADQYNDGHVWVHPRARRRFPVPLVLPFDEPPGAAWTMLPRGCACRSSPDGS